MNISKLLLAVFILIFSISIYSAEERKEEVEAQLVAQGENRGGYEGHKFPLIAYRAIQLGKIEIIKNELKKLASSGDSKFVRSFVLTIFEDLQKVSLGNHEEFIEKLNNSLKNLNEISHARNISQKDLNAINGIKAKINALVQTSIKTLDLSRLNIDEPEQIDLNENEPIMQDTYLELITLQNRKGQPYILARVETEVNGQKVIYYFDAHELNKYIFNNYPIFPQEGKWSIEEGSDIIKHKKGEFGFREVENPLNRVRLKANNINYFVLDSLKDNQFKYLASFKDLIHRENQDLIPFFYKNYGLLQPELIYTLRHNSAVNAVAISSNGQVIATGDNAGVGKIWNANNGQLIKNLDLKARPVKQIKISPNNQFIACITKYYTLIYDMQNNNGYYIREFSNNSMGGDPIRPFVRIEGAPWPKYYASIEALEFAPDSQKIAYIFDHRNGKVINSTSKELVYEFRTALSGWMLGLKISKNGLFLITEGEGEHDDYVVIRDFDNGQPIIEDMEIGPEISKIEISNDNEFLVSINPLKIWNFYTGQLLHNLNHFNIKAFAITQNDKNIISASENGEIKIWNVATGELLKTIRHNGPLDGILVSHNNRFFISYGNNVVQVWDIKTGKELGFIVNNAISSVALSADDKFIIIGSDDGFAKVWKI